MYIGLAYNKGKMNIRCIIVDDEPLAREGMELLLKEPASWNWGPSCSNAYGGQNKVLTQEGIDLIFLDIRCLK